MARQLVCVVASCLALTSGQALQAQTDRATAPVSPGWSLAITGGGSYAMSDLEIVPGIDQNGGWAFDAGLGIRRGRLTLGVGYERLRFGTDYDGSTTVSGVYAEPRLELARAPIRLSPYVFVHGGRVFDYKPSFCCSVYEASANGRGWIAGAGFGVMLAPMGPVRLDLSAGVSHLTGEASGDPRTVDSWRAAGPLLDVRVGASVPLIRGLLRGK